MKNDIENCMKTLKAAKLLSVKELLFGNVEISGYLHEGKKAPIKCPACLHPQSYFEIQETNY